MGTSGPIYDLYFVPLLTHGPDPHAVGSDIVYGAHEDCALATMVAWHQTAAPHILPLALAPIVPLARQ